MAENNHMNSTGRNSSNPGPLADELTKAKPAPSNGGSGPAGGGSGDKAQGSGMGSGEAPSG